MGSGDGGDVGVPTPAADACGAGLAGALPAEAVSTSARMGGDGTDDDSSMLRQPTKAIPAISNIPMDDNTRVIIGVFPNMAFAKPAADIGPERAAGFAWSVLRAIVASNANAMLGLFGKCRWDRSNTNRETKAICHLLATPCPPDDCLPTTVLVRVEVPRQGDGNPTPAAIPMGNRRDSAEIFACE